MLYGLMLPSGNDAANELAYWAGEFLCESNDGKLKLKAFVAEMNK
jgi:D-alanyl-D-alanine carboxypeptidase